MKITYFISVYPIVEISAKYRTGYGQTPVVLGLDQYTIVTNIQKELVPKILSVKEEGDKKSLS